jgi:hypothetical protein
MIAATVVGTAIIIMAVVTASLNDNQIDPKRELVEPYEQIWNLDLGQSNTELDRALHILYFESDLYSLTLYISPASNPYDDIGENSRKREFRWGRQFKYGAARDVTWDSLSLFSDQVRHYYMQINNKSGYGDAIKLVTAENAIRLEEDCYHCPTNFQLVSDRWLTAYIVNGLHFWVCFSPDTEKMADRELLYQYYPKNALSTVPDGIPNYYLNEVESYFEGHSWSRVLIVGTDQGILELSSYFVLDEKSPEYHHELSFIDYDLVKRIASQLDVKIIPFP